jgi:hypothetical protein
MQRYQRSVIQTITDAGDQYNNCMWLSICPQEQTTSYARETHVTCGCHPRCRSSARSQLSGTPPLQPVNHCQASGVLLPSDLISHQTNDTDAVWSWAPCSAVRFMTGRQEGLLLQLLQAGYYITSTQGGSSSCSDHCHQQVHHHTGGHPTCCSRW